MASARSVYRFLARLYPARFREDYGAPLERQFLDDYREARGLRDRTRFWAAVLWDFATSVPLEFAREVRRDIGYSIRAYRTRSLASLLAVAALALAIGVTTGVFSVVNALMMRDLPFKDPAGLVTLERVPLSSDRMGFHQQRTRSLYLSDRAVFLQVEMNLGLPSEAARVKAVETSANFLALLGAEPVLGRSFVEDEDISGRDSVAIIAYALWQRAFGGDPGILGSTVRLNGVPLTVIGIAAPGFDYPDKADIWVPSFFSNSIPKRGAFAEEQIGRLMPGVGFAQAREMFDLEMKDVNERNRKAGSSFRASVSPLRDRLAGPVRQASMVLLGTVVSVVLIACANVAQLLLSRVTDRRQELALRAVLGASRARLVQQLFVEAMLLTLAAAAAGLIVARWAAQVAASVQPPPLVSQSYRILDWRVLGFAVGLAALTGIIFGILPAIIVGRMQPGTEVMRIPRGGARSVASRMRKTLMAVQAAFAIVLLAGSLTMGHSFLRLLDADLGFVPENVITLNVSLVGTPYRTDETERQYFTAGLERLRAIPGVQAAGVVSILPFAESYLADRSATPGYFRAIGADIVAGRDFSEADLTSQETAVIVNEEYVKRQGIRDGAEILGRPFQRGDRVVGRIAGVVKTIRSRGPARSGVPEYYLSTRQGVSGLMSFVVRVNGNAEQYLAICRDVLQRVDRGVPVHDVKTFAARLDETLARPRFYTTVVVFLAGFALLVEAIGIYGVASYSIGQRKHEMGIRAAVGASTQTLRSMLMREGLMPILAGMSVGLIAVTRLGSLLRYLVSTTEPLNAWTYAAAGGVLLLAAGVAIWTATQRIVKLDPMSTLRTD